MENSTWWWIVVSALIGAELLTGTFYLLMVALGAAAAALAAHMGLGLGGQLIAGALVGSITTAVWHMKQSAARKAQSANGQSGDKSNNLDIGALVFVEQWQTAGSTRVQYRGTQWTAQLRNPIANPAAGSYRIVDVQNNMLIVDAA